MSRPRSDPAHGAHVLLDTVDGDTVIFLGFGDPDDRGATGLTITYDGTGMAPSIRLVTGDGEIELRGEAEITRVTEALKLGRRMAKAFGEPIPVRRWLAQHQGDRDAAPV